MVASGSATGHLGMMMWVQQRALLPWAPRRCCRAIVRAARQTCLSPARGLAGAGTWGFPFQTAGDQAPNTRDNSLPRGPPADWFWLGLSITHTYVKKKGGGKVNQIIPSLKGLIFARAQLWSGKGGTVIYPEHFSHRFVTRYAEARSSALRCAMPCCQDQIISRSRDGDRDGDGDRELRRERHKPTPAIASARGTAWAGNAWLLSPGSVCKQGSAGGSCKPFPQPGYRCGTAEPYSCTGCSQSNADLGLEWEL